MIAKPNHLLTQVPDGILPKPLHQVLLERRATRHFSAEEIPDSTLRAILELTAQSPSGYNLQPWRFILVTEGGNRERLRKAAMDQSKVGEAPVVVIAVGMKNESRAMLAEIVQETADFGAIPQDAVASTVKQAAGFLDAMPMDVWVNRHTMIAVTTMMLVAESFGYDTAPMEGFDPEAVKREFEIPDEAEVVALLAIGRSKEPRKPYPGRLPLSRIVYSERFGNVWEVSE